MNSNVYLVCQQDFNDLQRILLEYKWEIIDITKVKNPIHKDLNTICIKFSNKHLHEAPLYYVSARRMGPFL